MPGLVYKGERAPFPQGWEQWNDEQRRAYYQRFVTSVEEYLRKSRKRTADPEPPGSVDWWLDQPGAVASGLVRGGIGAAQGITDIATMALPQEAGPDVDLSQAASEAAGEYIFDPARRAVEPALQPDKGYWSHDVAEFTGGQPAVRSGIGAVQAGRRLLSRRPADEAAEALREAGRGSAGDFAYGVPGTVGAEIGAATGHPAGEFVGSMAGTMAPSVGAGTAKRGFQQVAGREEPGVSQRPFQPTTATPRSLDEPVSAREVVQARDYLAGRPLTVKEQEGVVRELVLPEEYRTDIPLSIGLTGSRQAAGFEQMAGDVPIFGGGVRKRMEGQGEGFAQGIEKIAQGARGGRASDVYHMGPRLKGAAETALPRRQGELSQEYQSIIDDIGAETVVPTYGMDTRVARTMRPELRGTKGQAEIRSEVASTRKFRQGESARPVDPTIDRQLRTDRDLKIQQKNQLEAKEKLTEQDKKDVAQLQQDIEYLNDQIDRNIGNTWQSIVEQRSDVGQRAFGAKGMSKSRRNAGQEAWRVFMKETMDQSGGQLDGTDLDRIFDTYAKAHDKNFRISADGTVIGEVGELQKIVKMQDADVAGWLMRSGRPTYDRLRLVKEQMGDAWPQLRGDLLESLARKRAGRVDVGPDVSSETFLTNWNQLTPDVKALLTPSRETAAALDALEIVARAKRSLGREFNVSRSASQMNMFNLIRMASTSLTTAAGLATVPAATLNLGATALAGRLAANGITGERAARMLADDPDTVLEILMRSMRQDTVQRGVVGGAAREGRIEDEDVQ